MTVIKTPVFIMSLFTSYCYRSLAFYTSFFSTSECGRIALSHQGEAVCQSDVSPVTKQYPPRSDYMSAADILWQASRQAAPFGTEES